jgi:tripartite-type tricarboxylate transporter receptor subunit TctC
MKLNHTLMAVALAAGASMAFADAYPTRPVTLVVGFPPGGGADGVARNVAEALGRQLGQPVVMDYKPGGGTTIASGYVAKAAPDGYTLYMTSGSHYGADKVLYKKNVNYDGKDFTPIARWTRTPLILAVSSASGITSVQDLVARAKAKPGDLTYSSSGSGVAPHLAAVLFENAAGIKMTHVPYKGGAPAVSALASGDVQLTFGTPSSIIPLAQAGRVKMIAVTSAQRSQSFPTLPTIAEAGFKDFDFTYWFGLFGPAGLPKDVADKLADASAKALADKDLQARLASGGNEASPTASVAEFASWAELEGRRLKALMQQSGATVD